MVMFVTLEQASDHLRRDTGDDDNDLILKISAASSAVQNYLKDPLLPYSYALDSAGVPELDSDGEPYLEIDSNGSYIPRVEVQQAVLIILGVFYADRDAKEYIDPRSGNGLERLGNMSLPRSVHWLLDTIRTPTLR
jgi:hypothetical protein